MSNTIIARKQYKDKAVENTNNPGLRRYYALRAAGLCGKCGKVQTRGEHAFCQACRDKARSYYQAKLARIASMPKDKQEIEREIRSYERNRANRTKRQLREKRLAAGLCAECGKRAPRPGMKSCEECSRTSRAEKKMDSERRKAYMRNRYAKLKQAGLCVLCRQPARPGRVYCEACRIKKAEGRK